MNACCWLLLLIPCPSHHLSVAFLTLRTRGCFTAGSFIKSILGMGKWSQREARQKRFSRFQVSVQGSDGLLLLLLGTTASAQAYSCFWQQPARSLTQRSKPLSTCNCCSLGLHLLGKLGCQIPVMDTTWNRKECHLPPHFSSCEIYCVHEHFSRVVIRATVWPSPWKPQLLLQWQVIHAHWGSLPVDSTMSFTSEKNHRIIKVRRDFQDHLVQPSHLLQFPLSKIIIIIHSLQRMELRTAH